MKRPGYLQTFAEFGQTSSSPTISNVSLIPTQDASGATLLNVEITVTNNSNQTMQTCAPNPGTIYNEGEDFYSRNFPPQTGAWRVGIDFDGNSTGTDHPYRWGFGNPLLPGQSTVVKGAVRLTSPGSKNYWAGLVQEWVAWVQDKIGKKTIVVTAPPPTSVKIETPAEASIKDGPSTNDALPSITEKQPPYFGYAVLGIGGILTIVILAKLLR